MSERETTFGGWLRPAAIGASVACYGASLALPALLAERHTFERIHGWECLLIGWCGPLYLNPIWIANVAWLAALVLLGTVRWGAAAWAGLGGAAVSLLTILYVWRGWLVIPDVVGTEHGDQIVTALGSGFYAWSAAIWIPTLAAAFLWRQEKLEAEGGPGRF